MSDSTARLAALPLLNYLGEKSMKRLWTLRKSSRLHILPTIETSRSKIAVAGQLLVAMTFSASAAESTIIEGVNPNAPQLIRDAGLAPVPASLESRLASVATENKQSSQSTDNHSGRDAIRSAVAAAVANNRDSAPTTAFGPRRVDRKEQVDRAFQAAQIEGCFGNGALKFDPLPVVGDFVLAFLALPYTVKAMATGHCSFAKP